MQTRLCNKRGADQRDVQAFRVRDGIDAAAQPCIGVPEKTKQFSFDRLVSNSEVEAEILGVT